jgi:tubulin polyglutamylase TTLL4
MEIAPMSWVLPEEYDLYMKDKETDPADQLYILKPSASSCGRGIKVIGQKSLISKKEGYICSKYIMNPHIFNDFKYDLRVYVLVTSFDPLRVYVYNEGLVRFATEAYTNNPKDLKKKFIHLTNFSVNKKSENFVVNKGNDEEGQNSSKWSFKELRAAFDA